MTGVAEQHSPNRTETPPTPIKMMEKRKVSIVVSSNPLLETLYVQHKFAIPHVKSDPSSHKEGRLSQDAMPTYLHRCTSNEWGKVLWSSEHKRQKKSRRGMDAAPIGKRE